MAILLTLLKILGIVVLAVLALLLTVLLLVLFVPFRYSFSGQVNDPEGSEKILHLDMNRDLNFRADVKWLLGLVHAAAAGGTASPEGGFSFSVRVLGFRVPLEKILHRGSGEKKEEEEKPPVAKEKKSLDERIEQALTRIERVHRRIEDAMYVLGTEYAARAKSVLAYRLLQLAEKTLPSRWGLTGVLGLGDPARSAGIYSAQGFLYPVTAGHVRIDAEYDLYRYDLQGAGEGRIRLFTFVYCGLRIILSGDVRRLIRRLRRGPASRHTNGNGNGNGHKAGQTKSGGSHAAA